MNRQSRVTDACPRGAPVIRFFNTVEPVISLYRVLGESLVAAGFKVEIIATSAQYRPGGKSLGEWARSAGVNLVELPGVSRYPRRGALKLIVSAYYAIFALGYALVARKAAVNVFLTQPPMFFAFGMMLKQVRRQPYVCIAMDLYPDILVALGDLAPHGLLYRLLARIGRKALKNANAVVAIGRCMAERLQEIGVSADTIWLIPNWAESTIGPRAAEQQDLNRRVMEELGLSGKFVVLYSGNMGAAHSFDEILEAAIALRNHESIFFLLIGEGKRRDAVARRVEAEGLRNIRVLPYQDLARAAEIMSEADAHVVTQRAGFEGLVVPSKAYSALAAGKPLIYIGQADGEIARMIVEEAVGFVIPLGESSVLVDTCRRLEAAPAERVHLGARARKLAVERYGKDRAVRGYTELLTRLASGQTPASGRARFKSGNA